MKRRLSYAALGLATIAAGLTVHLRGMMLTPAWRDVLGDAIWATMMTWLVSAAVPGLRLSTRCVVATAICYTVELSQLYHAPSLDALRATMLGRLTLGSGFDQRDLLAYVAGVLAAALLERGWLRMRVTSRDTRE